MSFGEEQITEFIKMLSGEKGVQDLFSFDMVPTADDMSAANIDKKMCKIQELQRVYDRTENLVKKTVQQNKLDNAHKALAHLQSSDNARRAKADAKLKAVAEATTTRTTHMKRPGHQQNHKQRPKDNALRNRTQSGKKSLWIRGERCLVWLLRLCLSFPNTCEKGGQAQCRRMV